jgi:hypothetical protein
MKKKGRIIIFDSDCIIQEYLSKWIKLKRKLCGLFRGPDRALDSFSDIQKAINFAMTLF